MELLLLSNALAFGFLFLAWSRKAWLDISIKFGLLCLTVGNLLAALVAFGFIVRQ